MPEETWPDRDVEYEQPESSDQNRDRWQTALDDALKAGSLRMERGLHASIYNLVGDCPRCGHATSQQVEFDIFTDLSWDQGDIARINFTCDCRHDHEGHGDNSGCGWGGPVTVFVQRPAR